MISKPRSVSKTFKDFHPMAISECRNDRKDTVEGKMDQNIEEAFRHLEFEKLAAFRKMFTRTILKKVRKEGRNVSKNVVVVLGRIQF